MKRASAMFAAAVLALAGCSGEDGAPGAAGQDGTSCSVQDNGDGTKTVTCGETQVTIEDGADGSSGSNGTACTLTTSSNGTRTVTCSDGTSAVLPGLGVAGKVAVSNAVATAEGADVVVTFNVKLNGANSDLFTNKYRAYRYAGEGADAIRFPTIATTDYTVTANGGGKYTARFSGLATTVGTTATRLMVTLNTGALEPAATVVADLNGAPKSTVSDQACINCHGDLVFHEGHHDNNPQGVGACVVCHVRADSAESRLGPASTLNTAKTAVTEKKSGAGTRLMGYVHGIHNSHNMPAASFTQSLDPDGSSNPLPPAPYTVAKPAGVYARNGSLKLLDTDGDNVGDTAVLSSPFSIGFPSYMNNCSTCHDTQENLDAVLASPVTYATCMSCHENFDDPNFTREPTSGAFDHHAFTPAAICTGCHASVGEFHGKRQMYTERNGLLYDGKDQSIEYGKRLAMKIESIARDDSDPANKKLVVQWSATFDGAAVNPCNATLSTAAPVFMGLVADTTVPGTGQSASNMNLLQAYAQGNDWVNAGIGTSPGQPVATNLSSANTTCADNVATSIIAASTTTATKGVIALQGKPQITFQSGTYTRIIQVRSPSPTREFLVADGSEPVAADKRRKIVENAKCLACHQGSLYQHGGNRVDSVELCLTCHNPASSDSFRQGIGVDASEAYDGKPGVTYDLRYMLHAIHSAGETNVPYVIYRSHGIYAFGSEAGIAALPNWPGAGTFDVFGSDTALDGTPKTVDNRAHNEVVVHYPRALNECGACHVDGPIALPSAATAVGVTVDPGATTWANQLDDVIESPATASCMSCHQSSDDATQSALRAHAYQFSWMPAAFSNGRADRMGPFESCLVCHGAGQVADYNAAHGQ